MLWNLITIHKILAIVGLIILVYSIYQVIYNIFFHPLANFPGPKLWTASRIPYNWHTIHGTAATHFRILHDKYGEVVRYSPNALSFTSPSAWDEIYGPFKNKKYMDMDIEIFGGGAGNTTAHILMFAKGDVRIRLRAHLSRALSPKAVASQELILKHYAAGFVAALKTGMNGQPSIVDIAHWYSIVTFDILSDLAFGTSFGGIESGEIHPWIKLVVGIFKFAPILRVFREIPGVKTMPTGLKAVFPLLPQWLTRKFLMHSTYGGSLIEQRLDLYVDRPDFVHFFTAEPGMTRDEIKENAVMLVTAGSEPTASFKAGVCYFLGKNEKIHAKLKAEIRSTFSTSDEMTLAKLAQLPYLNLVIKEGLRMFPPAADIFPRVVPVGGEFVMGSFLPEGTHVSISAIAASYSSLNFTNPDVFDPDRWTEARVSLNPNSSASQPFGQGHRSCIGRNLALAEIRLMLASLILNFDFELLPQDAKWLDDYRVFIGWEKRPLWIRLVSV